MYYIVVKDNIVTLLQQDGRVETSGELLEFDTLSTMTEYIETNNLEYADNVDVSLFDVESYKLSKINEISQQSFDMREAILPEYNLVNAGLGVYDEATVLSYKLTVQAFRDEFYRVSNLINAAETRSEIDAISISFPTSLIIGE